MKTSRANMNKHYQKQHIKKEYAAARKAGTQTASTATKSTGKTIREKASDKVKDFIAKNKKVFAWLGAGLMILSTARYTPSAIRTANSFATCISRIISIWKTGAILWTPCPPGSGSLVPGSME